MKVYALVGESGTGKSHRALQIAQEYGIPAIIDDGLLIVDGKYAAGYSGKYELTKTASVKRAIFLNPEHAREVREAIQQLGIDKILVIGISERMVNRIVEALSLEPISQMVRIEDIASQEEMETARTLRHEGNHAIPLPKIQVEEAGLGRWIRGVRGIFHPESRKQKQKASEMTIVHPRFVHGGIFIHDRVFKGIVSKVIQSESFVVKHLHTEVDTKMGVFILAHLSVQYDKDLYHRCKSLAERVQKELKTITGLPQIHVGVHIQDIVV